MADRILCSVRGRPPHPINDPECMPATKPIAQKLAWALQEINALRDANFMLAEKMIGNNQPETQRDDRPGRDLQAVEAFLRYCGLIAWAQAVHDIRERGADMPHADIARLNWLDAACNEMLLEFGFEIDGGVYLRIDAPGHGGTDIREKNSARAAIDSGMTVAPAGEPHG